MDITLSEDQERYRRAARDLLQHEHPTSEVRAAETSEFGYSTAVYQRLGELGYLGLLVPEEHEGVGGDWLTAALFYEEAGRVLLTGPVLSSLLAGRIIQAAGSTEQQARLANLATGRERMTLAVAEEDGAAEPATMSTRAERAGDAWTLHGTKWYVQYADSVNAIIVAARTEQEGEPPAIGLFLVEDGAEHVSVEPMQVMSGERYCTVSFDGAAAAPLGDPLLGAAVLNTVLQEGAILEAARAVGSAAQLLDMATEYAKNRVQFGRPIGAFQALQHMLADLATDINGTRLLVYYAAWLHDEGEPWETMAAMARLCASESFNHAARTGHQIHGGYGFIMDTDVQLYVRRSKIADVEMTGAEAQRDRIGQALGI